MAIHQIKQSKRHSLLEATISTIIGFGVALLIQLLVFPQYNVHVSLQDNVEMTAIFTTAGIIRSYVIRRIFNRL